MADRSLPGWVTGAGYGLIGVSAVGLPVALTVAALDTVRDSGSVVAQRVVLAVLVVLAIALVIGLERGLTYAVKELGIKTAAGILAGLIGLVVLGVIIAPVGLVLVSVGVLVGVPTLLAGAGALAYLRWKHGPRPAPRVPPSTDEVRAQAEARRAAVRARHDATREAVARGYIGPGFTEGA